MCTNGRRKYGCRILLLLISKNLKRSRDHDHTHLRDNLSSQCKPTNIQNLKSLGLAVPVSQRYCRGTTDLKWVIRRLGLTMINLHTKFKVSTFTHHEDMKGNAKCRNWGGLGITGNPRSTAMSPLDRAHTTFCSTLIETVRLTIYLVPFSS